eukprot:m.12243 g.12243  ORF g.12243 m.12243 type:complete len:166 (+) comp4622_c0_seq1:75-572(+)
MGCGVSKMKEIRADIQRQEDELESIEKTLAEAETELKENRSKADSVEEEKNRIVSESQKEEEDLKARQIFLQENHDATVKKMAREITESANNADDARQKSIEFQEDNSRLKEAIVELKESQIKAAKEHSELQNDLKRAEKAAESANKTKQRFEEALDNVKGVAED